MEQIDVAIVGAGVTGLAPAAAIAARGLSVCVLERHLRPGLETSTHNSGVIHAGIYYPAGTLKARLCVEGRQRLYAFCAARAIPHDRCGKLVVARDTGEIAALEALLARGRANGADARPGRPCLHRAGVSRTSTPRRRSTRPTTASSTPRTLVKTLLRDAEADGAIAPARHAADRRRPIPRRHRPAHRPRGDPRRAGGQRRGPVRRRRLGDARRRGVHDLSGAAANTPN